MRSAGLVGIVLAGITAISSPAAMAAPAASRSHAPVPERKRLFVLLGKSNLPRLQDWYEMGDPIYRGHVREPVIADLQQLMEGVRADAAPQMRLLGAGS